MVWTMVRDGRYISFVLKKEKYSFENICYKNNVVQNITK